MESGGEKLTKYFSGTPAVIKPVGHSIAGLKK